MNTVRLTPDSGQAATEFIIAAVFVLVPLFLIIPLIGKYIDIRHSLVQQARYEAWEYTVWFGPDEKIMHSPDYSDKDNWTGRKSWQVTRQEAQNFFFNDPSDLSYGTQAGFRKPNPLWVDHRGDSLFKKTLPEISGTQKEEATPDPTSGVFNTVLKSINWVTSVYGDLISTFDQDGGTFDAIYTNGFYSSHPTVNVRSVDMVLPTFDLATYENNKSSKYLTMEAQGAVISNYWNSGSTAQVINESKGLVFSGILAPVGDLINGFIKILNKVFNAVNKVLPVKVVIPSLPQFGYVKKGLIPYEHLDESDDDGDKPDKHTLEKVEGTGLYYYKKE